jgi:hypothetical protein
MYLSAPAQRGRGTTLRQQRGGWGLGMEACSNRVDTCPYQRASLATSPASGGGKIYGFQFCRQAAGACASIRTKAMRQVLPLLLSQA